MKSKPRRLASERPPDRGQSGSLAKQRALGYLGKRGPGVLDGPGLAEIDFSVFKTIPITEKTRLLFRAEAFNIANRANFGIPNFLIFSGDSISPSAGQIAKRSRVPARFNLD
jgi:hypothetical protein